MLLPRQMFLPYPVQNCTLSLICIRNYAVCTYGTQPKKTEFSELYSGRNQRPNSEKKVWTLKTEKLTFY
jgi:hypothetical protein